MPTATTRPPATLLQMARWSLLAGLSAFLLVAMLLITRRFAVEGVRPIDPVGMLFLVAVCTSLALLIRLRWSHELAAESTPIERWAIWLLPSACLLLLGFSVITPEASGIAVGFTWLMIVAEEGFLLWRSRERLIPFARTLRRHRRHLPDAAGTGITVEPPDDGQSLPPEATQSLVRTQTSDGVEAVTGTLRASFQPGERTVYVHVGFCPPLPHFPRIESEQTDGPEAQIKLAQALPHGARFDVRLKHALSESSIVELAFHAVADSDRGKE